ncbi:MAG: membrane dipeptidase [Thermoanaerobaculia bacterium]
MPRRSGLAGLVFDIDGTLLDSNELHARAWEEAFREFGKRIPVAKIRPHIGKGGDLLVPDLLNAAEMRDFGKKVQNARKALFRKKYLPRAHPFPGIRESFERLRERGIPIVLASSSNENEVAAFVEILDVEDLVDDTTSSSDAEFSKPVPEIFSAALDKIRAPKSRTAIVGDTPYDILRPIAPRRRSPRCAAGAFPKNRSRRRSGSSTTFPISRGGSKRSMSISAAERLDRMTDEAREVHRRAIIVDGHCDTPFRLKRHEIGLGDADPTAHVTLRSLEESGLTASFFAAYVPPYYAGRGSRAFADRMIDIIERETARYPERLLAASDTAAIRRAKESGRTAILIGIEGGHAIEDSIETLEHFAARGVRYLTLTHVNTNNWADSSTDDARHGGLSRFGREVVRAMNRLGVIVDISHVADTTFYHALETSSVPVIASHSSCRELTDHPRNLSDAMLRDLAQARGVCMINFYSAFINQKVADVVRAVSRSSGRKLPASGEELPDDRADWAAFREWYDSLDAPAARLDDVLDHIVHAAEVAGADSVGIGSDFDGVPALPEELSSIDALPLLTEAMLQRGFHADEVEKVLGGNFMRVFGEVEAGAR